MQSERRISLVPLRSLCNSSHDTSIHRVGGASIATDMTAQEMDVFYSRCLLCACTPADLTPHLHIFSEAGNQLQLADKIYKYLNIQIDGELPQNVCCSCMEKLEVTHELVTCSQQARVTLLHIRQQTLDQEAIGMAAHDNQSATNTPAVQSRVTPTLCKSTSQPPHTSILPDEDHMDMEYVFIKPEIVMEDENDAEVANSESYSSDSTDTQHGSLLAVESAHSSPDEDETSLNESATIKDKTENFTLPQLGDVNDEVLPSTIQVAAPLYLLANMLPATPSIQEGPTEQEKIARKMKKNNHQHQVNKVKRSRGEEYESYSTIEGTKVKRGARSCGGQCQASVCTEKQRACVTMSEEQRELCFSNFWQLTNYEKQVYIKDHIAAVPTKTRTGDPILTKHRTAQNHYFIKVNGTREIVCKAFFLSVHDIGDSRMRSWFSKDLPADDYEAQTLMPSNSTTKKRLTSEAYKSSLTYYSLKLDQLPTVESYCSRENCNKRFTEKECRSILNLYNVITKQANEDGNSKLSWPKFHELFKERNLALPKLQKDVCDTCCKYDNAVTDADIVQQEQHRSDVLAMRNEKTRDKQLSIEDHFVMVIDVEKILPLPKLNKQHYFLHKLQLKNYTSYDLQTKAVVCYLVLETEAGSDSSIFATLQCDIIRKKKLENPNLVYVIVYSVSQNRNVVLSNALLDLAIQLGITIQQKFLIPGHSQNEGDACHSAIEKAIRNKELYCLEDYVAAIKGTSSAYKVEVVHHTEFLNFENCRYYSSICPWQGAGEDQLRALKYTASGDMFYKLDISADWAPMPYKLSQPSNLISPKYTEQIPISAAKYRDLNRLKEFVPPHCHQFYEQLPHQ